MAAGLGEAAVLVDTRPWAEFLAEVAAPEAAALVAAGRVAVVDVRSRSEWEAGHLPTGGAASVSHVAFGSLPERAAELPRDRPLLVYCMSGARSALAASLLAARGFSDVLSLGGGIEAWQGAGQAIEGTLAAEAGASGGSY